MAKSERWKGDPGYRDSAKPGESEGGLSMSNLSFGDLGSAIHAHASLMNQVAESTVSLVAWTDDAIDGAFDALPREGSALWRIFERAYVKRMSPGEEDARQFRQLVNHIAKAEDVWSELIKPKRSDALPLEQSLRAKHVGFWNEPLNGGGSAIRTLGRR